jgi:WD40 repeat protein
VVGLGGKQGEEAGQVVLLAAEDGHVQRILSGGLPLLLSVQFSPDGALLVSGGDGGMAYVYRVGDWELIRTLNANAVAVCEFVFTADGLVVGLIGEEKWVEPWEESNEEQANIVRFWRVKDGELVQTLKHDDTVQSLAVSPDGRILATATEQQVSLWAVQL